MDTLNTHDVCQFQIPIVFNSYSLSVHGMLTNQQFDDLRLAAKITFAESEAARYVLVHGNRVEDSVVLYGHYGIDKTRLLQVLQLFKTAK